MPPPPPACCSRLVAAAAAAAGAAWSPQLRPAGRHCSQNTASPLTVHSARAARSHSSTAAVSDDIRRVDPSLSAPLRPPRRHTPVIGSPPPHHPSSLRSCCQLAATRSPLRSPPAAARGPTAPKPAARWSPPLLTSPAVRRHPAGRSLLAGEALADSPPHPRRCYHRPQQPGAGPHPPLPPGGHRPRLAAAAGAAPRLHPAATIPAGKCTTAAMTVTLAVKRSAARPTETSSRTIPLGTSW